MSSRINWQTWVHPEETAAMTGIGVYVEDCRGTACMDEDPDEEPAWMYATPLARLMFPRMAMPKPSTGDQPSPYESPFGARQMFHKRIVQPFF